MVSMSAAMPIDATQRRLITTLLVLGIVAVGLWVAGQLAEMLARVADVVLVFVFAWALAYLLLPPVAWLERRTRLGRAGAVATVYLAFVAALGVALSLTAPVLAAQLAEVIARAPEYGDRLSGGVRGIQGELGARGIPVDVAALYGTIPGRVAAFAAEGLVVIGGVVTAFIEASLVIIVAFFMLIDGERLWARFLALLSPELAAEAELFRRSADRSFGGFLRGQLILGLVYGVLTWLALLVIGVPYAALLGLVSGVLMVIPFFGAIIAMFPPLLVALPQGFQSAVATFVVLVILQNVMLNVVGPRLMAHTVGIHPLFVFLALLLGARVAGFWGVFLALPIAGVLNVFVRYFAEVAQGQRARVEAAQVIPGKKAAS